jgi:hypothetical protein
MARKRMLRGRRARGASGGTAQRVLARPKPAKANIGTPKLEANPVEGITSGDDRLALLNALQENRWNRRCKLLPNLKLIYPSDDESRQIAELAKVKDASWFARKIQSVILDAHLSHSLFLGLSIPRVKEQLERVAIQAIRLGNVLGEIDVGRESRGSKDYAGWLIERELALGQSATGGMILIPEYIDLLDALSGGAHRAKAKPMHFPKGASGNPAFDQFIEDLLMSARMSGGRWTNYKLRDGTWTGTLLETLGILKKYLPDEFFPTGVLGRSVEHIRKKLKDHIRKAP